MNQAKLKPAHVPSEAVLVVVGLGEGGGLALGDDVLRAGTGAGDGASLDQS